jgi:hypothetical protein
MPPSITDPMLMTMMMKIGNEIRETYGSKALIRRAVSLKTSATPEKRDLDLKCKSTKTTAQGHAPITPSCKRPR